MDTICTIFIIFYIICILINLVISTFAWLLKFVIKNSNKKYYFIENWDYVQIYNIVCITLLENEILNLLRYL